MEKATSRGRRFAFFDVRLDSRSLTLPLNRFTAATMARARGTELKLTTVKSSQMDMVTNLPLNLDDLHIKLEKIK